MSANSRSEARELRKRVVRLEAETARLELIATLGELRRPRRGMQLDLPGMFEAFSTGKGGWIAAATALLGGQRLQWILKAIPLALAGWRLAQLVRGYAARRKYKAAEQDD
jgi:hypothetical protein